MNVEFLMKNFAFIELLVVSSVAMEGVMFCGDQVYRTAILGDATACVSGAGQPDASDINGYFGSTRVSISDANSGGDSGSLSITNMSGAWGSGDVEGEGGWNITEANFWATFT